MEKNYQVTGFRKGDKTAKVSVVRDTLAEVEAWIAEHRAEENNAHAYQVMTRYNGAEGWKLVSAYYLLNGMEVNERQFLNAVWNRG
jgi:hypothetical protein